MHPTYKKLHGGGEGWHGYMAGARCRLAYGPADATATCLSKIQIGFTFLGSPDKGPRNDVLCVINYLCSV